MARKMGVDIESIRDAIKTDTLVTQVRQLGDGKYPLGDGMKAVVRESNIITVYGAHDGAQ